MMNETKGTIQLVLRYQLHLVHQNGWAPINGGTWGNKMQRGNTVWCRYELRYFGTECEGELFLTLQTI